MLSLLLTLSAFAGDAPSVEMGWFHGNRGEWTQARSVARAALSEDANHYGAHRLNAVSHQRLGETDVLQATTAAWLETEPTTTARLAHAAALAVSPEGDCDKMVSLLTDLPEAPELLYVAKRIELDAARRCDLDGDAIATELSERPQDTPRARRYGLQIRLSEPVDKEMLSELQAVVDSGLSVSGFARTLWDDERKVTGKLKAARKMVLAQAAAHADSADVLDVDSVATIYRYADHADAEAMAAKLVEIAGPATSSRATDVLISVYTANRQPTHEMALAALDALSVEGDADAAEALAYFKAQRLTELDREDEAHEVLKAQVLAMEDPGSTGNMWAYGTTESGRDLDVALQVIETVIAKLSERVWTADDGAYADWAESRVRSLANYNDTRGWLLHELGRDEDAIAALTVATSVETAGGVEFAHMGLSHAALEHPEEALGFLSQAFAKGIEDAKTKEAALAAITPLFESHGPWHPEGLDGYLRDLTVAPAGAPDSEEQEEGPHSLIGQPLPIMTAAGMKGADLDLNHDGVLVVDVWATWCGPCVTAMPTIQEVAGTYADRGVRVVGLSVDEKQASVTKFFKDVTVEYELGWISDSGFKTFDIDGIPSLFVVGPDGNVAEYISGYSPGDTRLEDTIERLLGEASD